MFHKRTSLRFSPSVLLLLGLYSTSKVTSNRKLTMIANLCKFYSQHQTDVSTPLQILALYRPVSSARASKVKRTRFQSRDPARRGELCLSAQRRLVNRHRCGEIFRDSIITNFLLIATCLLNNVDIFYLNCC